MTLRPSLTLALAAALASCAPAAPAPARDPGAGAELTAVAEALFAAMATRDTAALRAIFVPDARIVSVRVEEGVTQPARSATVGDFVASIGRSTEPLRERIWAPRVEVGAHFASLWAPYDFHRGDRFSHCGHDAFHFARVGGVWKILALSYTVVPSPCPPAPRAP